MALFKPIRGEDGGTANYHRILFLQTTTNKQNSIAVLSYVDDLARSDQKEGSLKSIISEVCNIRDCLIQVILALFGVSFDITDLQEKLLAVVNAASVLLTVLGIVVDPTTKGVSDSSQARTYTEPK